MFDDLFCATVLASVGSVLAAAVLAGASQLPTAATLPVAPAQAKAASPAPPERVVMKIHQLPRVVVTGNRSRDGDMLAADQPIGAPGR